MFRAKRSDELVTYYGHVLGPHITCTGNVEIWDQALGCPTCGEETWTGKTSDDDFHAHHPFMFEEPHDPGDEDPDAWGYDAVVPAIPFGGWRFPSYPPAWFSVKGFSWPSGHKMCGVSDFAYMVTEPSVVYAVTDRDPGDEHVD